MSVVIGSLAASQYIGGSVNDIDLVMDLQEAFDLLNRYDDYIESFSPVSSNKFIMRLYCGELYEIVTEGDRSDAFLKNMDMELTIPDPHLPGLSHRVPPLEVLYLTKKSHVHCASVHFEKTIRDYHILKTLVNEDNIPECMWKYYRLRKSEAELRTKHKTPSLQMTNEEFFDRSKDIVGYVFVHDDIHEAVKHYDRPVYEMMKKDFTKAHCEKDMFESLPYDTRVACVQEESYVIALERYILTGENDDLYDAYKTALMRICTTLCSGFFRDFAIENYAEVLSRFSADYAIKFKDAYDKGQVNTMSGINDDKATECISRLQLIM